jgi:hypothetical protein
MHTFLCTIHDPLSSADVDDLQVFSAARSSLSVGSGLRGSKCLGGFHQGSIILRGLQAI